jgi:D-aspartate ligase
MNIDVLILGSDPNAYYMARCYHEIFNKKAYIIAQRPLSFTTHTNIINQKYVNNLWEEQTFLKELTDFKKEHKEKTILISTNETYTKFISKNKNELKKHFIFNVADEKIIDTLIDKDKFYKTYKNSELTFPKTYYIEEGKLETDEKIEFPVVIKPSDVRLYNHINFNGKKKVYKINNEEELTKTVEIIRKNGYGKTLILQEFIPGGDDALFDAVLYSNSKGKVEFITFAQIALQERTGGMVGNPVILMNGINTTEADIKIQALKIKNFIEKIGYTGFAGVDMKYDYRTKEFKILEINARQTRQSYYLSLLDKNLIKVLIEDLILNKTENFKILDKKVLLTFVPKKIAKKYITNPKLKNIILQNWKTAINPMKYKQDKNFKRKLLNIKKSLMYIKDFKNPYWR